MNERMRFSFMTIVYIVGLPILLKTLPKDSGLYKAMIVKMIDPKLGKVVTISPENIFDIMMMGPETHSTGGN